LIENQKDAKAIIEAQVFIMQVKIPFKLVNWKFLNMPARCASPSSW
jgi:hypothetical protein